MAKRRKRAGKSAVVRKPDMGSFGFDSAKLRALRDSRGWSQQTLAYEAAKVAMSRGVPERTAHKILNNAYISKLERGAGIEQPFGRICFIASALGVDPRDFLRG